MKFDLTGPRWVPAYWPSFIEHPEAQQATEVGVWLRLVLLPAILVAGFLGNGLTLALMRRPAMRGHSYGAYMTALAASDSLALLIRLLFWINLLARTLDKPVLVSFRSQGACAVVEYVCTANHVLCSWLVVCLTYERVVVVVLPLKSARFVKAANSVKVVAVAVLSSCLLTGYVPAVVRWNPDAGGCVISFPRELYAHFVLATVFVSLLPLFLICCGNLVIVVVLSRQSLHRLKFLAGSAEATTSRRKPAASEPAGGGGEDGHVGHEDCRSVRAAVTGLESRVAGIKTEKRYDINGNGILSSTGIGKSSCVPCARSVQSEADQMPSQSTRGEPGEAGANTSMSERCSFRRSCRGECTSKPEPSVTSLPTPTNTATLSNCSRAQSPSLDPNPRGSQPRETNAPSSTNAATKPGAQSSNNEQQVRRVTFTLLCVSLAFLLLVMPNALLVLALGLRPDWSALQPLLDPLALLWDGNFAVNFYLYVFAGASFRAEVLRMLGWTEEG